MSSKNILNGKKLDQSGISRIMQIFAWVIFIAIILFISAGRWDWQKAWLFLIIYQVGVITSAMVAFRLNPEVINERGRIAKDTKSWDKIIVSIYTILSVVTFVIAGLDERYHWSYVPLWLIIAGCIGLVLGLLLTIWVMTSNAFLSTTVHIQKERGHKVATTGPYHFVRHPMYAGSLLMFWAIPMILGSWMALIPSAANAILFVVRTYLEDKTLQVELPGYADYAQRTRFRLIPGIW